MRVNDEPSRAPSSNWLALQKVSIVSLPSRTPLSFYFCQNIPTSKARRSSIGTFASRKRRKLSHPSDPPTPSISQPSTEARRSVNADQEYPRGKAPYTPLVVVVGDEEVRNGELVADLRRMVQGEMVYSLSQQQCVLPPFPSFHSYRRPQLFFSCMSDQGSTSLSTARW